MPGGIQVRLQRLEDFAVGLVLALALLVLHDPALLVEPRLSDRAEEVTHPVRLQPQREVDGRRGHVLEVVGAVVAGRAVLLGGADPVEGLEVVVVEVLAAVEHQVLEQVREAGLAAASRSSSRRGTRRSRPRSAPCDPRARSP